MKVRENTLFLQFFVIVYIVFSYEINLRKTITSYELCFIFLKIFIKYVWFSCFWVSNLIPPTKKIANPSVYILQWQISSYVKVWIITISYSLQYNTVLITDTRIILVSEETTGISNILILNRNIHICSTFKEPFPYIWWKCTYKLYLCNIYGEWNGFYRGIITPPPPDKLWILNYRLYFIDICFSTYIFILSQFQSNRKNTPFYWYGLLNEFLFF